MLVKELDNYELKEEFKKYNRDYYSLEWYQGIIDYFEDIEYSLDVIAICCSFSEYTRTELLQTYEMDLEEIEDYTYCVCIDDKSEKLEMLFRRLYEEIEKGNKEKAQEFIQEINKTESRYLVRDC